MPPRASYWKHFHRVGNTATCTLGGCPKPAVSCGKEPTPGQKKVKTGTYSITRHLQRHHPEQWAAYQAELEDTALVRGAHIKQEQERDESVAGTVRLYDVSTNGGRQAFLNQVLPDTEQSALYWSDDDPRTIKGHQGILSRMILDFDPFRMVERRGFAMDMRLNMPNYKIRTHHFYAGLVDKAYEKSYQGILDMLRTDDPEEIWMTLDGWSACSTGYIGAELHYLHNWRRKRVCLGCEPFEERHTGEALSRFFDKITEGANIRHKMGGTVTDTAANMVSMMSFLTDLEWAGCANHIIQLIVNGDILSMKEICSLLSTCKSLTTAYHSSINFARAIHEAQMEVMGRRESELPWALLQEVSTRWNSQHQCMKSVLKSEGAIRQVLASGEFDHLKSLAGVKFGVHQLTLLKKVVMVLEPFYRATLQLSHDSSCISEIVPLVTQLKEDLAQISEEDQGVKGWKRLLAKRVEERMGHFETVEKYSVSCILDPRCWMSCFTHDENRVRARELLITRIKERIPETPQVVVDLLINPMAEGESWEQMAKRRKTEKQAKLKIEAGLQYDSSVESLVDSYLYADLQTTSCLRFWELQEPALKAKGPVGEAFLAVIKKYLTPPSTSTCVERLFSAAGLIMEAKRNRLCPDRLNHLLFLRENFLLMACKLVWW